MPFLISLLLLAGTPRVAILDFENLTHDRSLDRLCTGIAETLTIELSHSPAFRLVERRILPEILKELKLSRSQFIDPATAQRMGKLSGANTIATGSFQRSGDQVVITARFVDVETGAIRATAIVEGPFKNIFALQATLASKLAGAALAPAPAIIPIAAFRAFSDGVYYLHQDLADDAITNFNRALRLAPDYTEAQFYKGVALEKRGRWDEAIALFRKALPSTAGERQVAWTWQAPVIAERAEPPLRGVILGVDRNEISLQADFFVREGALRREKRVIYAERSGKNTVLQIVDPALHAVRRVELPDDQVTLDGVILATDRLAIVRSAGKSYGIGADGSIWWHMDLPVEVPNMGTASDSIYAYFASPHRLAAFDDRSLRQRWERQDLVIDRLEPLKARKTTANGEVWIAKTDSGIHAIQVTDGKDAWAFATPDARFSQIVTDRFAIVFEWDRRVSFVDLDSGKSVLELPVPQSADSVNARQLGAPSIVSAAVQGDALYFLSKTGELYAVRLGRGAASLLWHAPVGRRIDSMHEAGGRLYAGSSETGELLVLDASSGTVSAVLPIGLGVGTDYAGPDIVVATDRTMLYGLDPVTGAKRWEYPTAFPQKDATVVKGVVTVKTSATQVSTLDAETGVVLWQYSGTTPPRIAVTKGSFFIIEENGLKEYAATKPAQQRISSKEILAELASALAAKGNVQEAAAFLEKARALDPDYPPVRLLRAQLLHDGRELATYAGLAGMDSQAGQRAAADLKRDYGLNWYAAPVQSDSAALGKPQIVGGKLLTAGRTIGGHRQVLLMNPDNGGVVWRQLSERFSGVAADGTGGRVWHATGDDRDQKAVVLYSLSIETGEPKELARFARSLPVTSASVSFVRGQVYVLTVSPDLASRNQLIAVDRFTPNGERLSSESYRVPEGTFLQDAIVPRPAISIVDGHPLLWPASSLLVDGDAVYAFTPDGTVYKQLHRR